MTLDEEPAVTECQSCNTCRWFVPCGRTNSSGQSVGFCNFPADRLPDALIILDRGTTGSFGADCTCFEPFGSLSL